MYSALADIKKLLPEETLIQLTDDEGIGQINQGRVDEAIAVADSVIDTYCGTKYSVPFTTAPPVVKAMSVDIAIYNLYSRRVDEVPKSRDERYKNAIRQLEGISRGLISIGKDPAPAAVSEGGVETNKTEADRVFTRTKMEGY
ncbi:MAG: DUF1320 domain-containing protein [Thermodesulfovibrionales bacterium]